jgi:hypothetical protein
MSEDTLKAFAIAIGAVIRALPEGVDPNAIARALVSGASDTGRCPVSAIADACEADLSVFKF